MTDGTERKATNGSSGPEEINIAVAAMLRDYADLLQQQGADGFRERAYRRAAETVSGLDRPVDAIFESEGRDGLTALEGIGTGIAGAIAEFIVTGHWTQLERLRGQLLPARLFQTLPGIGPVLAQKLADEAHLETLEELEAALHAGDLHVAGLGNRRKEALMALLSERLRRFRPPLGTVETAIPDVGMLLDVDRMYRERAEAGMLRKIAPRRFNPTGEAWLPIMHARHDDWHFTALFSNTSLAHRLDRTQDWVVIYFQKEGHGEGRCTVVTETHGPQIGERVVRGREDECAARADG
jgi:hypothetical protein